MTAQEYEQFLHDAEIKLARLKALYEQWFQGIERTEPVIVRKDLDRSLEMLKKNMPRNTALRFRTQQLSARYGTYGIYWGRIGRQIEEGTYKRVLARASRHMGSTAAPKSEEPGWEIDVDIDEAEPAPSGLDFSEGDLDAILGALTTEEEKPKTKPTRSISPFGFGAGLAPSKPPQSAAGATFGKPADAGPKPPAAAPVTATMPKPRDVVAAPVSPSAAAKPMAAPIPAPAAPIPAPAAPAAPPIARPAAAPPPGQAIPAPRPAPVPVSRPAVPTAAAPLPPARPAVPAPVARPPAPVAAPPAIARPASAPSGVRAAPAAPSSASLDEQRMRAIHASYVDARRKNNEGADVRYEALAESVQKMIPKLREKHGGKAIDFEVVLQNGKVGLKPKVTG